MYQVNTNTITVELVILILEKINLSRIDLVYIKYRYIFIYRKVPVL